MRKYSLTYISYSQIFSKVVHITINGNNQGLIQNPNIYDESFFERT